MAADPAPNDDAAMSDDLALKMRTWWRRDELDEQLVGGADPGADPYLARRAGQLRARSTRIQLADTLEFALRETRKAWSMSARLPLRRVAVRECADDLIALARRLRDDGPIDVQGAAMVSRLVFDGTSPLYRDGVISLRYAVRSARLALDPIEVQSAELWAAA
jgi:hypothetical protein